MANVIHHFVIQLCAAKRWVLTRHMRIWPRASKATAAERSVLPSPTSVCNVLVLMYCVAVGIYLSILPRQLGELSQLFFDFQLLRDLLRAQPEAHVSDVLFVLIGRIRQSVQYSRQTRKQEYSTEPGLSQNPTANC